MDKRKIYVNENYNKEFNEFLTIKTPYFNIELEIDYDTWVTFNATMKLREVMSDKIREMTKNKLGGE